MEYVEIPILEAAARCGVIVDYNIHKVEVEANCPFCDDRKKHLSINTVKNKFRCNRCKVGGNSITLYAKLHNVDNLTAYKELTEGSVINLPIHQKKPVVKNQYETKPLSYRHDTYYDMLQMLNLSKIHRDELIKRGLDNAVIE